MKKEKQRSGDRFRQRIAFNLAKECLLGNKHDPSIPQADLFIDALSQSKLASADGTQRLEKRTYKSGWFGERKPQRWLQALLDDISHEYGGDKLVEWNERIALDKSLHERKLQEVLAEISSCEGFLANETKDQHSQYRKFAEMRLQSSKAEYEKLCSSGGGRDGLYVGYFPGVNKQPSNWINRNIVNDVLHEHLIAIDVACLEYTKENISECNKLLNRIHERWNPHGSNCFFEFKDFSQSDFITLDEGDYLKKVIKLNGSFDFGKDRFDPHIVARFKSPDSVYQIYDVFSPARISEFLISIPISKNISDHELLDFWLLDFASSVVSFHWLFEAYRRRDGYKIMPELNIRALDLMAAGLELFWGEEDIQSCLCRMDIFSDSAFYEVYQCQFRLIRERYKSLLQQFGINVAEVKELLTDFDHAHAIVFTPS